MENAEENSENSGLSLSDNGDSSLTSLGESEEEIVDSFVTPPIREVIDEEKLKEYMQSKPHVYPRGEGPNGKNIDGLLLSFIRMSSLPVEMEEQLRQRKEIEFLNRLEAKQRLENMKKARAIKENGNSSTETQKLAIQGAGASGSGSDSIVRAVASDVSLEEGMFRNLMLNMPLVSTRCVGPNGEKTQGRLLYEYKEGEEVKIVCVCHGYFLSPAEFVKHAGGGDVENPLRHITIKHVANW